MTRRIAHQIDDSRVKQRLASEARHVGRAKAMDGVDARTKLLVRHLVRVLVVLRAIATAQVATPGYHQLDFDGGSSDQKVEDGAKWVVDAHDKPPSDEVPSALRAICERM